MEATRDSRLGVHDKPTGCRLNRPPGPAAEGIAAAAGRQYRIPIEQELDMAGGPQENHGRAAIDLPTPMSIIRAR